MSDPSTWALVSVRASSPGKRETVVYARGTRVDFGPSIPFDTEAPRMAAVEGLLAAAAADILGNLRQVARSRRLPLDEVEARLEARLSHPLAQLGVVGEEGEPAIEALSLRAYLSSSAPPDEIETAWLEALRRCPVVNTLRATVSLELSWQTVL